MVRPWDKKMKQLFNEVQQDFVAWLLPGATFNGSVSVELEGETTYADLLSDVSLNGQRVLLHIENQRTRDARMAERLWEYNLKATLKYKCPVWSVIIYLQDDGKVAEAPLTREMPTGRMIHRFDFEVIKLWEIPTRELKEKGLLGLLPLLPLTQGGSRREIVEEAIVGLTGSGEESNAELLTLTYGLASLVLVNEADQEWLIRRFTQMYDMLRETRAYKDIIQEGIKEGLEKGHQEMLQELRQAILDVILERFPKISSLAKKPVDTIDDPRVLRHLIVKMSTIQTAEEALQYLLNLSENT